MVTSRTRCTMTSACRTTSVRHAMGRTDDGTHIKKIYRPQARHRLALLCTEVVEDHAVPYPASMVMEKNRTAPPKIHWCALIDLPHENGRWVTLRDIATGREGRAETTSISLFPWHNLVQFLLQSRRDDELGVVHWCSRMFSGAWIHTSTACCTP